MKLTRNTKKVMLLAAVFIIYTILIIKVDVQPIGPHGSPVGFGSLNALFAKLFKYRWVWYIFSKITGYIGFAVIGLYAFFGALELYKRKKLFKVDRDILILGCFYILVGIYYLLFNAIAINFRPVVLEDVLEASYPSSHTVMGICVFLSAERLEALGKNGGNELFRNCLKILALLTVFFRMMSGVHWITDIIGGVALSAFLLAVFDWALERFGVVAPEAEEAKPAARKTRSSNN